MAVEPKETLGKMLELLGFDVTVEESVQDRLHSGFEVAHPAAVAFRADSSGA